MSKNTKEMMKMTMMMKTMKLMDIKLMRIINHYQQWWFRFFLERHKFIRSLKSKFIPLLIHPFLGKKNDYAFNLLVVTKRLYFVGSSIRLSVDLYSLCIFELSGTKCVVSKIVFFQDMPDVPFAWLDFSYSLFTSFSPGTSVKFERGTGLPMKLASSIGGGGI